MEESNCVDCRRGPSSLPQAKAYGSWLASSPAIIVVNNASAQVVWPQIHWHRPGRAPSSCGFLMVVTQEPTQPLATSHRPTPTNFRDPRKQQDVGLPLMIPLGMIVCNILAQRPPQRTLTKENELRQTLLLHRPHPPLRIGVQVRTTGWQHQRFDLT